MAAHTQEPEALTSPVFVQRPWWVRRWLLLAAVTFFIVMAWPFLRKQERGEWSTCFVRAAKRLQAREMIHYSEPNAYAYPPAMAMLAVPLANLPFQASLAAWYLVNVAATTIAVVCAWRLAGGGALSDLSGRQAAAFAVGVAVAARFLIAPLENQQFDAVITACLLAGCLALWRGRQISAAVLLGTAAAMKCTPLLFVPYLLWRGRIACAGTLLFTAVALNRLPDLLWPRTDGNSYLGDWVATFLLKVGRSAPGVWESDLVLNQSLSGLFNRFWQAGLPLSPAALPDAHAVLAEDTVWWLRLLVYGAGLALLVVAAWHWGRPGRSRAVGWAPPTMNVDDRQQSTSDSGGQCPPYGHRWDSDHAIAPGEPRLADWATIQTGIDAAGIVCLMLLLSPMSSKSHYVVLILPCLLLGRAVVDGRLNWRLWLPLLAVLGPLSSKGVTGKPLGDLLLAWGFPTWFAIALLIAMWRLSSLRLAQKSISAALRRTAFGTRRNRATGLELRRS